MGIKREYFCCLCKEKYEKQHFDEMLIGIRWEGSRGNFVATNVCSSERHLCKFCIRAARALDVDTRVGISDKI